MMIDDYYSGFHTGAELSESLDKKYFYLGTVTQVSSQAVTMQTDNLTLLSHRLIRQSDLIPNTINYYVVIDSVSGVYFGQLVENRIPSNSSREKLFDERRRDQISSEAVIDVLGFQEIGSDHFKLPGFSRPGIAEKVYLANERITHHFISSIEVKIKPKQELNLIPPFAHLSSFRDVELSLDAGTLFNRHLLVVGTTNSGKSTTALSILSSLVHEGKKVLLIDPTGEYKNSFTDEEMEKLTLGVDTVVDPGVLSVLDWSMIFECNENTQQATLSEAIRSLRYQKKYNFTKALVKDGELIVEIQRKLADVTRDDTTFDVELLPAQIAEEAVDLDTKKGRYKKNDFRINNYEWLRQKVQNQFDNTSFTHFFRAVDEGSTSDFGIFDLFTEIDKFCNERTSSLYIDASCIGTTDGIGGMVIDLISNHLLEQSAHDGCSYVIFIDEVHRYAKKLTEPTAFYSGLTSIAREGRKKGIFLFLTTQNPNDVSSELLGQVGTLIIHRLTHQDEIGAIKNSVSSYSVGQIMKLNQGEAILSSVNLLEDLHLSVEACARQHDNETPEL